MKTVKQILIEARDLIADQEHWTQGELAIEDTGAPVDPTGPEAYAWCADGAITKTGCGRYLDAALALKKAAVGVFPQDVGDLVSPLVAINDGDIGIPDDVMQATDENDLPALAHANVLKVFDAAIAACGEE